MKDFNELWKFATRHGSIVQERSELEHVFNIIKGCKSYLEIGTAEGNSLYVLSHALEDDARIVCVDWCETHTEEQRNEVIKEMEQKNISILAYDSHSMSASNLVRGLFDVVLIDAGHTYADVIADAMVFGKLATKYILFHDMQLPEVKAAFEWYCKTQKFENVTTFINSDQYGYGIVTL